MDLKNINHLQALISFLLGILLTIAFVFFYGTLGSDRTCCRTSMHRMSDGTMMNNIGMDMNSMMEGMLSNISDKTGEEFDKAFLSEMIIHHQGAVAMAKVVLEKSNRPELKQLANDIISAQEREINMMQNWQKVWFK